MTHEHLEQTDSFKLYKEALNKQGLQLGQCIWEAKTESGYKWPDVFCFQVRGSDQFGTVVYKQHGAHGGWGTYIESPHNHFQDEAKLLAQGFNT